MNEKCHDCGKSGVYLSSCPVCRNKTPDEYPFLCFECYDKHMAAHEPELFKVEILHLGRNSYAIRAGKLSCDELCWEEALGVIAAGLLKGYNCGHAHPFLKSREAIQAQRDHWNQKAAENAAKEEEAVT